MWKRVPLIKSLFFANLIASVLIWIIWFLVQDLWGAREAYWTLFMVGAAGIWLGLVFEEGPPVSWAVLAVSIMGLSSFPSWWWLPSALFLCGSFGSIRWGMKDSDRKQDRSDLMLAVVSFPSLALFPVILTKAPLWDGASLWYMLIFIGMQALIVWRPKD